MKKSVFTLMAVLVLGSTVCMAQRNDGRGGADRRGQYNVSRHEGNRRNGCQDDMYGVRRGAYERGYRDGVRNEHRAVARRGGMVVNHPPRVVERVVCPTPVPPPPPCAPVPPPPARHHHTVHVSPEGVVVGAVVGTVIGALLSR